MNKAWYETEGPIGVPMTDRQAQALDSVLKDHPEAQYQRSRVEKAASEFSAPERSDVSWITTEALDRDKEIILASGWSDVHYAMNPIVTMGHDYDSPPVGKSQWRKRLRDGEVAGIKAKTIYPRRPQEWTEKEWPPDTAFALVSSGLMVGKSIGFLTLKTHQANHQEQVDHPGLRRVIDEWLLLEYACTWLPANQEAITLEVEKTLKSLTDSAICSFTTWDEIKRRIDVAFPNLDLDKAFRQAYDRMRGRVQFSGDGPC